MNFSYSEDQLTIANSVERIFIDLCSDEQIKSLRESGKFFHSKLWSELSNAGILGLPFDDKYGGLGLSLVELCSIIEQQGQFVAPIPLISNVVESGMTLAQSENELLKQELLPSLIGGDLILSPARPYTGVQAADRLNLTSSGNGVLVANGRSGFVPYAGHANAYIVQASDSDSNSILFYCDGDSSGLRCNEQTAISDEPAGYLEFDNVAITESRILAMGAAADSLIEAQKHRVWIAQAAAQVGVLSEGLRRTAEYVSQRKQFGFTLGSFQAVSQQAANAYMEIESLRSVLWRAMDDIQNGFDLSLSAPVCKYWVAEAGHLAAHTVLHLHGGIGQDLDYPIHRYFLFAKQLERYLGGQDSVSSSIGKSLITKNSQELDFACS